MEDEPDALFVLHDPEGGNRAEVAVCMFADGSLVVDCDPTGGRDSEQPCVWIQRTYAGGFRVTVMQGADSRCFAELTFDPSGKVVSIHTEEPEGI